MPAPDEPLLDQLRRARLTGRRLSRPGDANLPRDLDEAYAIAWALVPGDALVAGYKVGATSAGGQRLLGLAAPFFGRVLAATVQHTPGRLADGRSYACEPEIGFVLGRDLSVRHRPYTITEVSDAVAALVPLIELNWPSYAQPFECGGLALIADNGVNAGCCLGPPVNEWRAIERAATQVTVLRNGREVARGSGAAVLGDPLRALHWLANALSERELGLKAGQFVACGAMTPPVDAVPGDHLEAHFGPLGDVELALAPSQAP